MQIAGCKGKDIVFDFFAGSATTANAVFEFNLKNNSNCRFLVGQIPEIINNSQYKTIAEITKERVRRVSKKIGSEQNGKSPLLAQAEQTGERQDLGFKVFRLERSNFRAWTDFTGQELSDFRPLLEAAESPFIAESTPDAILTEILLLEGFPLNSKVEVDNRFERNKVFRVQSEFSEYELYITLNDEVWEETIDHASDLEKNDIFICLDSALSDENKVQLADVCRLKTM